jgi:predicted transcriptional regulator YheO
MLDKILNILNKEKNMDNVREDQTTEAVVEAIVEEVKKEVKKDKKENTKPEIRMFPDKD